MIVWYEIVSVCNELAAQSLLSLRASIFSLCAECMCTNEFLRCHDGLSCRGCLLYMGSDSSMIFKLSPGCDATIGQ